MRTFKNPNLVCGILLVYTTGMYLYFFPRNHQMSDGEKWGLVAASYIIIAIVWLLMRHRKRQTEKMKSQTGYYPGSEPRQQAGPKEKEEPRAPQKEREP